MSGGRLRTRAPGTWTTSTSPSSPRRGHARHRSQEHVSETASRAAPDEGRAGHEVFWHRAQQRRSGNPDAVEWMHASTAAAGRSSGCRPSSRTSTSRPSASRRQGLVVAPGGKVTPEMEAILKIIARENLVLATGHVHPEEIIAVVRRGRELGVKNMLITHGLTNVPGLTMAQAKEVDMGAVIEVCFLQFQAGPNAPLLPHALDADQRQARRAGRKEWRASLVSRPISARAPTSRTRTG